MLSVCDINMKNERAESLDCIPQDKIKRNDLQIEYDNYFDISLMKHFLDVPMHPSLPPSLAVVDWKESPATGDNNNGSNLQGKLGQLLETHHSVFENIFKLQVIGPDQNRNYGEVHNFWEVDQGFPGSGSEEENAWLRSAKDAAKDTANASVGLPDETVATRTYQQTKRSNCGSDISALVKERLNSVGTDVHEIPLRSVHKQCLCGDVSFGLIWPASWANEKANEFLGKAGRWENPEKRRLRLEKMRAYAQTARLLETPEERAARLEKLRINTRKWIERETDEARQERLRKMREFARQYRRQETPEQRQLRLERMRLRARIRRSGASGPAAAAAPAAASSSSKHCEAWNDTDGANSC